MRDALIFNGASNLDFQEIRTNVIRIPEVVQRVREAQTVWDQVSEIPLDLANFIASDDETFLSHIKLKSFATMVVQVGLLDRYLKSHALPEYVVGAINGDSPMKVAIGLCTLRDMIVQSTAVTGVRPRHLTAAVIQPNALDLPVLAGVQLVEYAIYKRNETGVFERVTVATREVEGMVVELVDNLDVNKLVMVGPGNSVSGKKVLELTARDVQVLESIDLDPMLSWFWSNLKESRLAIAN